ncbi:Ranbinding protein 3like [Caligus rogercresseyi]|uniref:Ranbinding protein 3like n=1 Tax=Caligus rogercresseyi TaxID=217165 RepID=A0A7T8QUP5_CALRO|nr:Ranbinding protein 3like [Caligus rogercresseyi]
MSNGDEGKSEVVRSILAPSKFSSSSSVLGGSMSSRSGFSGLKASKFNFGSPANSSKNESQEPSSKKNKPSIEETEEKKASASTPPVSFLPLTKTSSSESNDSHESNPKEDKPEKKAPQIRFTFGENVESRVESANKPEFTFGENLSDRVSTDTDEKKLKETTEKNEKDSSSSSGNLFQTSSPSLGIASSTPGSNGSPQKKTLSEAAADYQESHAVKRKYEEVSVKTGEEDESNVVQLPGKLFAYDNGKRNWSEKGRGILRLNDMEDSSRLVMRSVGVLKVILNTKLFEGMSWERPSEKSIRFSGSDDEGNLRVFLLTGSSKDMDKLFILTKTRISSLKNKTSP